jgi:hypothetical protein
MTGLGGGLLYMHRKGRYGSYFKRDIRLAASPLSSRPQPPIARYEPLRRVQNLLYWFISGPRYQSNRQLHIEDRERLNSDGTLPAGASVFGGQVRVPERNSNDNSGREVGRLTSVALRRLSAALPTSRQAERGASRLSGSRPEAHVWGFSRSR